MRNPILQPPLTKTVPLPLDIPVLLCTIAHGRRSQVDRVNRESLRASPSTGFPGHPDDQVHHMALIKYASIPAEVSGSIGGVTFARVHSAKACRTWRAPVNKRRTNQNTLRQLIARFSHYWSASLTQAERDAWDTYAPSCIFTNALGENYDISGFNMFVRNSVWRNWYIHGDFGPMPCPLLNGFPNIHAPTFSFDASTGVIAISAFVPVLEVGDQVMFTIYKYTNAGRRYPIRRAVWWNFDTQASALPWTLYTYAPPPAVAANVLRQFIQLSYMDSSSRVSIPFYYDVLNVL